jgi:hypothetical protein
MDADKEIDVNGAKRTSEVADRKIWTTMEIRKSDKFRPQRLELYVHRVKNNLDVFTGKKIEGHETQCSEMRTMNAFELNSIHLNEAGFEFAVVIITENAVEGYPACVMPVWIHKQKSNDKEVVAILGSEPKIGENPEVTIKRDDFTINN